METPPRAGGRLRSRAVLGCLAAVLLAGLSLRLHDLDRRSMSHVESFVPGLDVPDWTRPPPRRTLVEVLCTTVHHDGHPPAYFVAMLGWSKAFGTSLTAYRMPSALLGALSIALVFAVALHEGGRRTALLAAGLLALNGHHVYWSQMARMYAPAAFLGLASTWLLWRVLEGGGLRVRCAYFLTNALMLWTQMYCWPLLFAQILWSSGRAAVQRRSPVALRWQVASVIAGFPAVSLAVYQDPPTRHFEPVFEYLEFGYLFHSLLHYWVERPEPIVPRWALAVLAGCLFALGVRPGRAARPESGGEPAGGRPGPVWPILGLALAVSAAMAAFASWSPIESHVLYGLAGLPLLLVPGLAFVERVWPALCAGLPAAAARLLEGARSPSLWLATIPVLCMAAVSWARPSFVARGTLVFTPFLLIAIARGLDLVSRRRWIGPAVLLLVFAVHADSVRYALRAESDPRDYAGLAREMQGMLQEDDLVLMTDAYHDSPLLYHLRVDHAQLVHGEYADVIQDRDCGRRVWVVWFDPPHTEPPRPMLEAVDGFKVLAEIATHGGHARLYKLQV